MAPPRRRRRKISVDDLVGIDADGDSYGSPLYSMLGKSPLSPEYVEKAVAGEFDYEDSAPVDIARVARDLGVSASTVRETIRSAGVQLHSAVFASVSGRPQAGGAADPKGLLQAAFGRGPRGGAVDAKAAAAALGVAPGTVRRWAAGTQEPTAEHLKALRQAARRAGRSKAGRRGAIQDFRSSGKGLRALKRGSKIWVSGQQGVIAGGKNYIRYRTVTLDTLTPKQIEDLLDGYEEGGLAGLVDGLTQLFDTDYADKIGGPQGEGYAAGWRFFTIEGFGFGEPE